MGFLGTVQMSRPVRKYITRRTTPSMLPFNINVDIRSILQQLRISTQRISFNDRWVGGGRFISIQSGGVVYALFNHPTSPHSATARVVRQTCTVPKVIRQARSTALPGSWAIACIKSGFFGGDQTFYNSW